MSGYTVQINSTYEEVDTAVDEIMNFFQNDWCIKDKHLVFTLNFALRELLINAVEHGNKMAKEKKVICSITNSDNNICIDVFDEGEGFELEKRMSEIAQEDLLRLRGRGIHIMTNMGLNLSVDNNHVTAKLNLKKALV